MDSKEAKHRAEGMKHRILSYHMPRFCHRLEPVLNVGLSPPNGASNVSGTGSVTDSVTVTLAVTVKVTCLIPISHISRGVLRELDFFFVKDCP